MPEQRGRRQRHSRDKQRDSSFDRFNKSRNSSRDCSFDRNRKNSTSEPENWREEIRRSRQNSETVITRSRTNSEMDETKLAEGLKKTAGILVLPAAKVETTTAPPILTNFPMKREEKRSPAQQKSLFDPNNPSKPIIVKSQSSRMSASGFGENCDPNSTASASHMHNDPMINGFPHWYDENYEHFKSSNYPQLLRDIRIADLQLQQIIKEGLLLVSHQTVEHLRNFLKQALEYLLCKSLRFCERENVEQHFWNILYHRMIELARKCFITDPENKELYKTFVLCLVDDGTKYFESLLIRLEDTYEFKINNYLGNHLQQNKSPPNVKLALISVQKLFLFLGDLVRYREEVNETANYGKCRQ